MGQNLYGGTPFSTKDLQILSAITYFGKVQKNFFRLPIGSKNQDRPRLNRFNAPFDQEILQRIIRDG
jgi:hypothetical protein